ncbi:HTH domain-containing protein [Halostella sp. PRR32]|uniref:HTH domain-containing protein n=1 Tax=Halostella sp. PRR32 TaxID=3098147 RepID=UPI002B1D749E|nr:HTH domain-containing protein [Halostella sp. PRR32]
MSTTLSVELLMREPVYGTHNRQQSMVRRLQELDEEDYISDFDVEIWGKRLDLDGDDWSHHATETAREKFRTFESWADEHDCSLEPAFTRRTSRIDPNEEPTEIVELPIMCLAVYDDGLRTLLPCSDGDDIYTVDDGIAALADEDVAVPGLDTRKIGTL